MTADPQERKTSQRQRMSSTDRKHQLIEVAVSFFSEKGFEGATTKEIANAAGVTEAMIYRLFETKEKFYDAILDHKLAESGAPEWLAELHELAAQRDDEAVVKALVSTVVEAYRTDPEYQRLMLRAALEQHELSVLSDSKIGLPVFNFLHDYISRRQKEGAMRAGSPAIAVFALVSLPVYYGIVRNLFGTDIGPISDETMIDEATTFILRGLGSDEPPKKPSALTSRNARNKKDYR